MKFSKTLNYVEVQPDEHFMHLAHIPWFDHCGESDSGLNKSEAAKKMLSHDWEQFMFRRNNELTKPLFVHHRHAFDEWTIIVKGVNEFLEEFVYPNLFKAIRKHGVKEEIYAKIRWWLQSYMQEEIYSSFEIPRFYAALVNSYQQGKLPCGWIGDYPKGAFLEY